MESIENPQLSPPLRIYLGEFPIVENKLGALTINLGRNVHITIHMTGYTAELKPGDKLPLYTEISLALLKPTHS